MIKSLLFAIIIFTMLSCSSTINVDEINAGKHLDKAIPCVAEKATDALLNDPYTEMSKTQTGFNEVLYQTDTVMYWGYIILGGFPPERVVNVLNKTNRTAFSNINKAINHLNQSTASNLIASWFTDHPPTDLPDSLKQYNTFKLKVVKNNHHYDVVAIGEYAYCFHRMEAPDREGVDMEYKKYTVAAFRYEALIQNGKTIEDMKITAN